MNNTNFNKVSLMMLSHFEEHNIGLVELDILVSTAWECLEKGMARLFKYL